MLGSLAIIYGLNAIAPLEKILFAEKPIYMVAYNDCFYFMKFAILLCGLALIFCIKVKAGGNAAAH